MPLKTTYCRVCESACGLIAQIENDRVVELRPDPDHPLSQGYACLKGTRFHEVQYHPERVQQPLLRTDRQAELQPHAWDETLAALGSQLQGIADRYGPSAIGLYSGNAAGHSLGAVLGGALFLQAFGTPKHYACLTLDNSVMFVVTEAVFGNPMRTLVADYANSDCVVLIGTDPLSSQPSQAQSHPGGVRALLERAQAGALIVVDPRRSSTAARANLHLQPKLGTDIFLLAALVREVMRAPRARSVFTDPLFEPDDLRKLQRAVGPFTAERASALCDVPVSQILGLCERLLIARTPLVWSGLGVLLGPHGTLGYWLTLALQAMLGGLDRPGGWRSHTGAIDLPRWFSRLGIKGQDPELRSRIGGYPAILGTLAAATMADDVLTPGPDQLKALVVLGGNPALSLPDTKKAQAALQNLELLVCVDLFVNDTGALAHAVLPAQTWLEREDVPIHMAQQRSAPHLQLASQVVSARGEARPDFEILRALAFAANRPRSRLARRVIGSVQPQWATRAMIGALAPFSWRALEGSPSGIYAESPDHGALRKAGTDLPGGRVHLAVPRFVEDLRAIAERVFLNTVQISNEVDDGGVLRLQLLSSVRPVETMNTWMHGQRGAARRVPRARIHPDDAQDLRIEEGELLSIGVSDSTLEVTCALDTGLRRGVIVLPFGWGHLRGAVGTSGGARGVNANLLVKTDVLEAYSGQPISNGRWVEVRKVLSSSGVELYI